MMMPFSVRNSHHPKMIARIISVTRNTKEMQNYTGEKSILAVFEEILLKSCLEQSKLPKDKTKVTVGGGKPLQYQARGRHGLKTLVGLNFRSKTAEK